METAQALQSYGVQVRVIALHAPGTKTKETLESVEVFRPRYMWPEMLEVLQNEGGRLPAIWQKNRAARLEFPLAAGAHALAPMYCNPNDCLPLRVFDRLFIRTGCGCLRSCHETRCALRFAHPRE